MLGVFFYFIHISLIYHIRSSSIKLGPKQLPELYSRVVEIAQRLGLRKVPDAYLHQAGGVLNAFATKFGRSRFVVLNSALVEACQNKPEALDFIIGHEVGHLHRNHIMWRMLVAPAMLIPFLGSAYSRACELTCDRYGFAGAAYKEQCTAGLVVLAAGAQFADKIDQRQFIRQKNDTMGFFMQIAQWLSSYPSLATRLSLLKKMS
jgi:Zn-dependent protease with chaperone function